MPKSRGHCDFDREGAGGPAENTTRYYPSRRAIGSITRWCVPFARRMAFRTLLSFNVTSSKEWSWRDRWDVRGEVVGIQVPSEDSEEATGICRREDDPGLVYTHLLSLLGNVRIILNCTCSFPTERNMSAVLRRHSLR